MIDNKIRKRKIQTQYLYDKMKEEIGLNIYKYYDSEESNFFSPIFIAEGSKKGIDIARELNANGIINSTGTFGLMPANKRQVFTDYCNGIVETSRMYTPNSEKIFEKFIALSIMENMDTKKLDNIVENLKKCL